MTYGEVVTLLMEHDCADADVVAKKLVAMHEIEMEALRVRLTAANRDALRRLKERVAHLKKEVDYLVTGEDA